MIKWEEAGSRNGLRSRNEGIEWLKCLEQRRMKRQQPRSRSKHKKLNVRLQMFVAKRMRLKGCTSLIRKTKRWRMEEVGNGGRNWSFCHLSTLTLPDATFKLKWHRLIRHFQTIGNYMKIRRDQSHSRSPLSPQKWSREVLLLQCCDNEISRDTWKVSRVQKGKKRKEEKRSTRELLL